jgi:hypothetical protein
LSYGVAAAAQCTKKVEALAQKIAGRGADAVTLEMTRSVARAEFELAQIRRIKVALIARMGEFGEFEVSNPLGTFRQIKRHRKHLLQNRSTQRKPCAERYRNCSSLIVTSDAQLLGATAQCISSLLEMKPLATCSCGPAKRSQFS